MTGSKSRGEQNGENGTCTSTAPPHTISAATMTSFVIQLGNSDCDVIGINDYFSVAGYKEMLRRSWRTPAGDMEGNKAYREALAKAEGQDAACRSSNAG